MDPDSLRTTGRVPHGGSTDPAVLDFSANINPYTPDGVGEVYGMALGESRRYPDDNYPDYRQAAAAAIGCDADAIVPTAGGLAAIRLAIEATVTAGDTVLVPYPSFGEYAREVRLQGGDVRFVPHDQLLTSDPAGCALAICCTPNNPTGEVADPETLAAFARRCADRETALLVDEAFLGFTSVPSIGRDPLDNVIVARSLTKLFGLPGLRAGFAVAAGDLRDALETARPAWNLGTPAVRVGTHCLGHKKFVERTRRRVRNERERLSDRLSSRFEVTPSDAPYLLLEADDASAVDDILEQTQSAGVVVRDARTFRGLDAHIRVAVKYRAANDRLLAALAVG